MATHLCINHSADRPFRHELEFVILRQIRLLTVPCVYVVCLCAVEGERKRSLT